MTRRTRADLFIIRVPVCSPAIAADRIANTHQALENDLCMPETAFSKSGYCLVFAGIPFNPQRDLDLRRLCTRGGGYQKKTKKSEKITFHGGDLFSGCWRFAAFRNKYQSIRIHAIAFSGGSGAIVKDMSQMRPAFAVDHFPTLGAIAKVLYQPYCIRIYGGIKAWPSRPGIEFCVGAKKRL